MANNLSNMEEIISGFMKEVLKYEIPTVDLRDDGEFMETFGLSHIKLFNPILEYIDRLKLMQSLENAELMTEAEMDEVGASFYNPRKTGFEAGGSIIFVLNDLPDDLTVTIPSYSLECTSKSGLVYRNIQPLYITPDNAATFYDAASFNYKLSIDFESIGVGEQYNVEPGEINRLTKGFIKYFVECYNELNFTGGIDTEDNVSYAQRIREESFAPNLGIKRGYARFFNSFPDVKESKTAGYGDPLMKRDVIGKVEVPGIKFVEGIEDLHWGTKVDAYIRGRTPVFMEDILEVKADEKGNTYVQLTKLPVIDVSWLRVYTFNNEEENPDIDEESLFITNYNMVKKEDFETEGTLEEDCKVYIRDERVQAGKFVRILYRYNELIQTIHDSLYMEENRPPTADVKIKEAHRKVIYGGMVLKMLSSLGLRDSSRSYIKQNLSTWVDMKKLGSELQFSDMLEPLQNSRTIEDAVVDYIHFPNQFFVTENKSRFFFYTLAESKRDMFEVFKQLCPKLYEVMNFYKEDTMVFDAFDFLHSVTFERNMKESLEKISFQSYEDGLIVEAFYSIRNMMLVSEMAKMLSPAVHNVDEHEYYELADLFLYEYVAYDQNDWQQILNRLTSSSLNKKDNLDVAKSLHFYAVYILVTLYVTINEKASSDPNMVLSFLRKITDRTIVEFDFFG